MELSELKRNKAILLAVLGATKDGTHQPCPLHGGSDCMDIQAGSDGIWLYNCHAGCGGGTVIDAAMKKYNVSDCHAAIMALEKELGVTIGKDEAYQEPRIDLERAEAFIADAHQTLIDSKELQEMYMVGKRGLTLDVCEKYRVGFVTGVGFKGKGWSVFGWVLPITDADGRLLGVKLHTERPPWPQGPKCLWAPFGTYPAAKPMHGTYTLWPPPEHWRQDEKAYLCPGELKALAQISAGVQSTAPTSGENKLPDRLLQRLKNNGGAELYVNYDDDAPKRNPVSGKMVSAGVAWKDSVVAALSVAGVTALPFALRRPQDVKSAPPAETTGHLIDASKDQEPCTDTLATADGIGEVIANGEWRSASITKRELEILPLMTSPIQSLAVRTYDPKHFLV